MDQGGGAKWDGTARVWGPVIPRASADALAAADRSEQGRRRTSERLAALDAQRARVARDGCAMAALRHI
jgi:hypothetical protein